MKRKSTFFAALTSALSSLAYLIYLIIFTCQSSSSVEMLSKGNLNGPLAVHCLTYGAITLTAIILNCVMFTMRNKDDKAYAKRKAFVLSTIVFDGLVALKVVIDIFGSATTVFPMEYYLLVLVLFASFAFLTLSMALLAYELKKAMKVTCVDEEKKKDVVLDPETIKNLKALDQMKESGVISEKEYTKLKADILAKVNKK